VGMDVSPPVARPRVRAGVLWAGGLATAVIAALVALVATLVCESILGVDLLPAAAVGVLGWSDAASYPAGAAVLALLATAVLHLLMIAVPQPLRFFSWLLVLAGAALAAAPFAYDASLDRKVATAIVQVIVVIAIGTLSTGVAHRAVDRAPAPPA